MRIIGVIDLLGGRAVHARAGKRAEYRPVRAVSESRIEPGDAAALAHVYLNRYGLTEMYVADLDAILGGPWQNPLVAAITALGPPVWLDAGISSVDQAQIAIDLKAAHVIVGLETLSSFTALERISARIGSERVAFSLDLRDGTPVGPAAAGLTVHETATRAADAGAGALIVIDLARIGTGSGLDLDSISRVRLAAPRLTLVAGGGIRSLADLERLAESGGDGALVATAVHNGTLGPAELAAARRF
jgi:phosphoribosylformimino-5-aminoimidazole carboxamide ribotide isomerase